MRRIFLALVVSLTGALTVPLAVTAPPAAAAADPATARAKLLPSPQIDGPTAGNAAATGGGVVWKQVIVGNSVVAGGRFTKARPFGTERGDPSEVPRSNLLAYNLTTGALTNLFASTTFNGDIYDMAVTPDRTKLVVVGLFTTVNGQARNGIAVFNLASDQSAATLSTTVTPSANSQVRGVAATNSTIFLTGGFTTLAVNAATNTPKATRPRVGAVSTTNGSVTGLYVKVDNGIGRSIVVSPDGKQVVFGGTFTSVNGSSNPGYGLYRANSSTGAALPLPVNSTYRVAGANAGVVRLASDSTSFYGGGFVFGAGGNSEGVFQASWSTGKLISLDDCHGDSYDVAPVGNVYYVAAHHHHCLNSGSVIPQTGSISDHWTNWHSTAWTKAVGGTNTTDSYGYPDHPGTPRPKLLNFFPRYTIGAATGQKQATFSVTGNSSYVLYGGEFLTVNTVAQQGLARFGYRSVSGANVSGPLSQYGANLLVPGGNTFTPVVRSQRSGEARISWLRSWDRDDYTLHYSLLRDGTEIWSGDRSGYQWTGAPMTVIDNNNGAGLPVGSTPAYEVVVTDPDDNTMNSTTVSTTIAGSDQLGTYASTVLADGASKYWRLDEGSGSSVADSAGPDSTTAESGVTRGVEGAITSDPDDNVASTFDGTANGKVLSGDLTMAPNTFSIEAWFKTSTKGGKIIGFGDGLKIAGVNYDSSHYDRHIYMGPDGRLRFGVAPNGVGQRVVGSKTGVNLADGAWHQAVATLSSAGMKLYVDGALTQQWADYTTGENTGGRWRIGGDSSWGGASKYFNGSIDDVAVYPVALSAQQVANHYAASGRGTVTNPAPPGASFRAAANGKRASFFGSATSATTISSYRWDFGDGSAAPTKNATHLYSLPGTYTVTFTVTDSAGQSTTRGAKVTVANARPVGKIVVGIKKKKRVNFYGSRSTDVDGRIVRYVWQFGDGTTATGSTVSHKYKKAKKKYSVRLTVTDENGASATVVRRIKTKR